MPQKVAPTTAPEVPATTAPAPTTYPAAPPAPVYPTANGTAPAPPSYPTGTGAPTTGAPTPTEFPGAAGKAGLSLLAVAGALAAYL